MNKKKIKVYIGSPSTGNRVDSQTYCLRELEQKYGDRIELVYPTRCIHRKFHDFARNKVVEEFLETDCDILWFLDADVTPPNTILDIVDQHEHWELAGAPYPVWMGGQIVMCVYMEHNGKLAMASVPPVGQTLVDGLATGCMFIKRHILEGMEKPYFEFVFDPKDRNLTEGEDLGFCRKMVEQGKKFYIDFAQVCRHHKEVDLLEVNDYAMSVAKKKVEEYDLSIRDKVQTLISQASGSMGPQPSTKKKSKLILPDHLR